MMNEQAFGELVNEIMLQGLDESTAALYARLIGDMPITADDDSVVVMENGREVARLKPLAFFDMK